MDDKNGLTMLSLVGIIPRFFHIALLADPMSLLTAITFNPMLKQHLMMFTNTMSHNTEPSILLPVKKSARTEVKFVERSLSCADHTSGPSWTMGALFTDQRDDLTCNPWITYKMLPYAFV
jgi:hypothetical protein